MHPMLMKSALILTVLSKWGVPAAIFALDLGKAATGGAPGAKRFAFDQRVAALLGTDVRVDHRHGFTDGRLYVAGLSNEEFSSKLRSVSYPFNTVDSGASVEIYGYRCAALTDARARRESKGLP